MNTTPRSSSNKFSRLSTIAAPLVLLVISMPAQSFALGTVSERAACTPDVFRLCSAEIPDVDRIIACMKANHSSLSKECREVMDRKPEGDASSAR